MTYTTVIKSLKGKNYMKTKMLRLLNKPKKFTSYPIKFISKIMKNVSVEIGIFILFGLLYIGSAQLVGLWLKLVFQFMK